jgi:hypothetical protein
MSDPIEHAKEAIEHAHHAAAHGDGDTFPRNVAMLVAVLAAALAIAEMGEKSAQNEYLTHHITASDDWNFYQAKNIRANLYSLHADLLDAQPGSADPALRKKIEAARGEAHRLDDDEKSNGRKQLAAKARQSEQARDSAFHRYHMFEIVVGALQIGIVLSSVSIVAKARPLAWVAGLMGLAAGAAGLAVVFSLV